MDDRLADLDNLPESDVLADEVVENIDANLATFRTLAAVLAARG